MVIGYERQNHMKTAGIRTHLIVSLASALMMLVSKYGFFDVLGMHEAIKLDPSRVAAGAVTAVGFLGAGVIFVRKQSVSGLTTSAGIWATVGVGSAIGAGMYLVGIATALMVILVHIIFSRKSKLVKESMLEQITLQMDIRENAEELMESIFSSRNIVINNMKAKRLNDETIELRLLVIYPASYETPDIIQLMREVPAIKSIEL